MRLETIVVKVTSLCFATMTHMRIYLEEVTDSCATLEAVSEAVQGVFAEYQQDGFAIGYVAGPVSCDGEEYIPRNLRQLVAARTSLMHGIGERAVLFTAPFVFTPDVYGRLGLFKLDRSVREAQLQRFWDGLLESGLINQLFFVPGWQRSPGARQEHHTATRLGIPLFYLAENPS